MQYVMYHMNDNQFMGKRRIQDGGVGVDSKYYYTEEEVEFFLEWFVIEDCLPSQDQDWIDNWQELYNQWDSIKRQMEMAWWFVMYDEETKTIDFLSPHNVSIDAVRKRGFV